MSTHAQNDPGRAPMSDAQLDAALGTHADAILPSSGFADAVMAAVGNEAPAPIPFPWKRAWPLLAAAPVALALLIGSIVLLARGAIAQAGRAPSAAGQLFILHSNINAMLHNPAGTTGLWIAVSLAIPLLCLLAMRRTLLGR
jgi:hypothetical protein